MDQGLKERLIGAAVLVALGVWLIPWLLDGRQEQVELDTKPSAVRLPAPDGPLPVRVQTLNVDTAKSEPPATETHPEPAEPVPAPSAVAETAVAVAGPPSDPAPAEQSAPAPKPVTPANVTDHGTPSRVAAATPPPAAKPAPKPASPATSTSAQAGPARADWAVQLGSFGAEDNARKLAQKANVYGYKPEVASIRASGRPLYRVRLGPYRSRAEADATASALSAHGFSPQVVAVD